MSRRWTSLLVVVALAVPAARAAAAGEVELEVAGSRFVLQSRFWVALHQTLLAAVAPDPMAGPETGLDDAGWRGAVAVYRERFAGRSSIFDPELVRVEGLLSAAVGDAPPPGLPADVAAALRAAAPAYRAGRWAADDRTDRLWIAVAAALLREVGPELLPAAGRAWGTPLPRAVTVDVAPAAGRFGAYTTGDAAAVHVTISGRAAATQGFAALETLLHEASHGVVDGGEGAVGPWLAAAAQRLGLRLPPRLWHAVLFYTSGELTRRALAARGVAYTPYADLQGVWERSPAGARAALESAWKPWLDGRVGRQEAVDALVRALGRPSGGSPGDAGRDGAAARRR